MLRQAPNNSSENGCASRLSSAVSRTKPSLLFSAPGAKTAALCPAKDVAVSRFQLKRKLASQLRQNVLAGDSTQNLQRFLLQRSRGNSQVQKHDSLLLGHTKAKRGPARDSAESRSAEYRITSLHYGANKLPLRECHRIEQLQNMMGKELADVAEEKKLDPNMLPVIAGQKPASRHAVWLGQRRDSAFLKSGPPMTGQYLPFAPAPVFIPVPPVTSEEIGTNVAPSFLHEMQSKTAERLVFAPSRGIHRQVYDIYEASPFQVNYGYDEFLKYGGMDSPSVDSTPGSYGKLCAGKGAPTKFVPNKARYSDKLVPYYQPDQDCAGADKTLIFESRFEGANLRRAIQVYVPLESSL